MGEAKKNPRSPQFRLSPEDSDDPICAAALGVDIQPTKAWKDANPAVEGETNVALVPPEELEAVFLILGQYVEPYRLAPQSQWAKAACPVAELHRMPFTVFKAIVQASDPGQPWKGKAPAQELDS